MTLRWLHLMTLNSCQMFSQLVKNYPSEKGLVMKNKIILGVSLVVIILTAFFLYGENSKEIEVAENLEPAKKEISVYVSGQVKTPAVVTLEDTGNLHAVDAVNAAGGLTDLADSEIINLAEPLVDGQHIHIPAKEIIFQEIPAVANSAPNKSAKFAQNNSLININTADEEELKKISGVGPVLAKRILEYRTNNGAFQTIEDIKKVKGIGAKTFEKMRDSITVN